jgi:hypothetical protein
MNSSEEALAKKRRRKEGMCEKCGRVKTHAIHAGMLRRKLVSGE